MNPLWFEQVEANMKIFPQFNISSLYKIHRDKPAIIIGAGPSLEKNIQYLNYVDDDFIVIAVDAVIKYLYELPVWDKVNYVITGEERPISSLLLPHSFFVPYQTILCASTSSNTYILERWRTQGGKIYFYNNAFYWHGIVERYSQKILPDIPGLNPLCGNISFMAVELVQWLGCASCALVGVDMQANDGKTHIGKCGVGRTVERINEAFDGHLQILKDNVKYYTGIEIINCTEGGKLDCFKNQTLQEFMQERSGKL